MKFLWLILLCFPLSAQAAGFCARETQMDPEFPAGLIGNYELIGKDVATGKPYAGTLEIAHDQTRYLLTRTLAGKAVTGEGWIERCGADKILAFTVRYETEPDATELFCRLGNDGDNYFRITCLTRLAGKKDRTGLEAWFQQH